MLKICSWLKIRSSRFFRSDMATCNSYKNMGFLCIGVVWAPLYITILFQFNFIECNCRPPWITMGDIEYIARYYWTLTSAARSFCEAANFKSASCIFISWVCNNKMSQGSLFLAPKPAMLPIQLFSYFLYIKVWFVSFWHWYTCVCMS